MEESGCSAESRMGTLHDPSAWYVCVCKDVKKLNMYLFIESFRRRFYPKRLTNEDIIEAIKTNKRAITCSTQEVFRKRVYRI